ncbi:MAG: transglycosylase SLT domain-containing protein [Chloroflexi bacterium]|nr:transglycosylase SLT domain-containing protein [Chloroflexota bacterium]
MTTPGTRPTPQPATVRAAGPSHRPGQRPADAHRQTATPPATFARALAQARRSAQTPQATRPPATVSPASASPVSAAPSSTTARSRARTPARAPAHTQSRDPASTAATGAAGPTAQALPGGVSAIVQQAAAKYGVDPALIAAVIEVESSFNPNAVSVAGATGLMQLMPATARGLGVSDARDPLQNVLGGAKLLGHLLDKYHGDVSLAAAAYNAGSGAVDTYGGVPPYAETRRYVPKVLAALSRYRGE